MSEKFDISNHSKIEEFVDNASNQLSGLDFLINNENPEYDKNGADIYINWETLVQMQLLSYRM